MRGRERGFDLMPAFAWKQLRAPVPGQSLLFTLSKSNQAVYTLFRSYIRSVENFDFTYLLFSTALHHACYQAVAHASLFGSLGEPWVFVCWGEGGLIFNISFFAVKKGELIGDGFFMLRPCIFDSADLPQGTRLLDKEQIKWKKKCFYSFKIAVWLYFAEYFNYHERF